jgi:formate dehydrogenase major subunit
MITLTLNGTPLQVEPGTTVLQAARQNGIHIPTLCDHPHLTPYGGCRLCVVEVKGMRVPIASCTLPAADGMSVETDTPALRESRATILNLLFSERNHFCPFCQVSGNDCELQQAAYEQEMTHWDIQPQWKNFPVDTSHPNFILDNNRCILCRRCLRACAEMSGNFTISVEERGAATLIIADNGVPFGESTCISCGSCVQVCPTGALIDRQSAYLGQDQHLTATKTVCAGCSVGCGVTVYTRDNRIVKIHGDWDAFNAGTICKIGRFTPLEPTPARIQTPLIRVADKLTPTSWEEALAAATRAIKPGTTAAYASPRLPLESLRAFSQLFAPASAPVRESAKKSADMLRTADCVLLLGVDLAKTHEVLGFIVKRNLPKGTKLIVIDPAPNTWDDLAHISIKAEIPEALKALTAAIQQNGLARNPSATPSADPSVSIRESVTKSVDQSASIRESVTKSADLFSRAIAPIIIHAGAPSQALLDLAHITGTIDAERSGLVSVQGATNSAGTIQLGVDKALLPENATAAYIALGDDIPSPELLSTLENIPYLVVQSAYENTLTARADVVLPAMTWAEQPGTYINLDGRAQTATPALTAPAAVRDNTTILESLAATFNLQP